MELKIAVVREGAPVESLEISADPLTPVSTIAGALAFALADGNRTAPDVEFAVEIVESHGEGVEPPVVVDARAPLSHSGLVSGSKVRLRPLVPDHRSGTGEDPRQPLLLQVDDGHGTRRTIALRTGVHSVGRADDNDIVINDVLLSPHHCQIEVGAETTIRDLSSVSGTWIDGARVVTSSLRLANRITVGSATMEVAAVAEPHTRRLPSRQTEVVRSPVARAALESPTCRKVLADVHSHGALLWSRSCDDANFLRVRLGTAATGSAPSSAVNTVSPGNEDPASGEVDPREKARSGSTVQVDLGASAFGLGGQGEAGRSLLRSIMMQVSGLHSPDELAIVALLPPSENDLGGWLALLPHAKLPEVPGGRVAVPPDPAGAAILISGLEQLFAARLAVPSPLQDPPAEQFLHRDTPRNVLLLVSSPHPSLRPRIVRLAKFGARASIHVIWYEPDPQALPAVCKSWCVPSEGADDDEPRATLATSSSLTDLVVEGIDQIEAESGFRAISPLVDGDAWTAQDRTLPQNVNLSSLLGVIDSGDGALIRERWMERDAGAETFAKAPGRMRSRMDLRVSVGVSAEGPLSLDLVANGPHALITGTTGSGKSCLLQAWLAGMALTTSPNRLNFLLVDFKGGAAFADLVRLPHVVGFVTTIPIRTQGRLIAVLEAEIQRRRDLINSSRTIDFDWLERRDPENAPARLVIVIDELRSLTSERPELMTKLATLLQQGRFLGIHLIAATQHPGVSNSGSLSDLWNLRIALRVSDEAVSREVLGDPRAAHFDPSCPGRGAVRFAGGRVVTFQTAYADYAGDEERGERAVVTFPRGRGRDSWEYPPRSPLSSTTWQPGMLRRIVDDLVDIGSQDYESPRQLWFEELDPVHDLLSLGRPTTSGEFIVGRRDRPQDSSQPTLRYLPDSEGNLAVFGGLGSGKSSALRSVGIAAGLASVREHVTIYGLDFDGGGLRPLEELPHVGDIVDHEIDRAKRVIELLWVTARNRAQRYQTLNVSNIEEFRQVSGEGDARIILLVDGLASLYSDLADSGSAKALSDLAEVAVSGRAVGVHIVASCDAPSAMPPALAHCFRSVQLRSEPNEQSHGDPVNGVVNAGTIPPGRGTFEGDVIQFGIPGGDPSFPRQHQAIAKLSAAMRRNSLFPPAQAVRSFDDHVALEDLPIAPNGEIWFATDSDKLQATGIDTTGLFMVAGPRKSGKTTALYAIASAARRAQPTAKLYLMGNMANAAPPAGVFEEEATSLASVSALIRKLTSDSYAPPGADGPTLIFIDSISSFLDTEAGELLRDLVDHCDRRGELVVAADDDSRWIGASPTLRFFRASRRGLILGRPSVTESELLGTSAKVTRESDYPPGRGRLVHWGRATRVVQVAFSAV